jgi:hypothetical protein
MLANYTVGVGRQQPTAKKVAVFVAHGMGQQIPFQTLDAVAEGLLREERAEKKRNNDATAVPKPVSRTIKFKEQWFSRVELKLKAGAQPVEAHVYEGYWAPLTEGKVTGGDVIRFLYGAGSNGVKNARKGQFKRWLFDQYQAYPIAVRTILYLLVTLAALAALVTMNSTIVVVAAGRALLAERPRWLTDGLFIDLTTTFNVVIVAMAIFGAALLIATVLRSRGPRALRLTWSTLTVVLFVATLWIVILAGLSIPMLFYGHVRGSHAPAEQLWHRLFSPSLVDAFNAAFDAWAWWLAVAVAAAVTIWWLLKILRGILRDLGEEGGVGRTLLVAIVFLGIGASALLLMRAFYNLGFGGEEATAQRSGLAWVLLVVASAFIKKVLVQFVGDVAIYVMPYRLDAFNDLRKEIKETVYKVARGVYEMTQQQGGAPEYDRVVIVGHSLGSVIVYDVLNWLIREDEAAGKNLNVVTRTPLLLTFGSPLDKTAFIFGLQGKGTSEARESLAASVQPLIQDYKYRPKQWINVYSPWDIISGSLKFYDLPGATTPPGVENQKDPDATTLLIAHTEYWENPLIFRRIYDAI